MGSFVLDASALLAYLHDEPGAEAVAEMLLERAYMSAANWAEVLSKVADAGREPLEFARYLEDEGLIGGIIKVMPLTAEHAPAIGKLREETRSLGLSLGDRACLALGLELDLPVATADHAWSKVDLDIPVRLIRPAP